MKKILLAFMCMTFLFSASCERSNNKEQKYIISTPQISRHPYPLNFGDRKYKYNIPNYIVHSNNPYGVDLRGFDLTALDLRDDYENLMHSVFDTGTKWPQYLPVSFNPGELIKIAKRPSLNITQLHMQGITGRGYGIAVIGPTLLVDHNEYMNRIKLYEEVNADEHLAEANGTELLSLAVGKNLGIAPEADLYYIATTFHTNTGQLDYNLFADALGRIIEINRFLPKNRKIKTVFIISTPFTKLDAGYKQMTKAIENAKKEGMFVVCSNNLEQYGYILDGAGRDPYKGVNDLQAYRAPIRIEDAVREKKFDPEAYPRENAILAPMDSICVASPTGYYEYSYYNYGHDLFPMAYVGGLYLLACQVNPNITPEAYLSELAKTGDTIKVNIDDKKIVLGKLINPVRLIEGMEK